MRRLALLLLMPQFMPRFYIYLFALMFAIALLATSLNLVLGFGGMYQFHHAVFYGAGAYAFALFATKSGLPIWLGYIIAPFCSAALGLVMGLITVRLNQLYFGDNLDILRRYGALFHQHLANLLQFVHAGRADGRDHRYRGG